MRKWRNIHWGPWLFWGLGLRLCGVQKQGERKYWLFLQSSKFQQRNSWSWALNFHCPRETRPWSYERADPDFHRPTRCQDCTDATQLRAKPRRIRRIGRRRIHRKCYLDYATALPTSTHHPTPTHCHCLYRCFPNGQSNFQRGRCPRQQSHGPPMEGSTLEQELQIA